MFILKTVLASFYCHYFELTQLSGATNYPIFSDRMWFFIMVFAVFIVMMKLTNGQTLGKKVVRIRVVETGHEKFV